MELWQDDVLVERKPLKEKKAEFEVTYQPGKLTAVSFDGAGKEIARETLETAGEKTCLCIEPEETQGTADTETILFVPIALRDEKGVLKMTEDKEITLQADGPASLLALGSARPETEKLFDDTAHVSWHGKVLAVLRSTGEPGTIRLKAFADGCEASEAQIVMK